MCGAADLPAKCSGPSEMCALSFGTRDCRFIAPHHALASIREVLIPPPPVSLCPRFFCPVLALKSNGSDSGFPHRPVQSSRILSYVRKIYIFVLPAPYSTLMSDLQKVNNKLCPVHNLKRFFAGFSSPPCTFMSRDGLFFYLYTCSLQSFFSFAIRRFSGYSPTIPLSKSPSLFHLL